MSVYVGTHKRACMHKQRANFLFKVEFCRRCMRTCIQLSALSKYSHMYMYVCMYVCMYVRIYTCASMRVYKPPIIVPTEHDDEHDHH